MKKYNSISLHFALLLLAIGMNSVCAFRPKKGVQSGGAGDALMTSLLFSAKPEKVEWPVNTFCEVPVTTDNLLNIEDKAEEHILEKVGQLEANEREAAKKISVLRAIFTSRREHQVSNDVKEQVRRFFREKEYLRRVLVEQPGSYDANFKKGLIQDILHGEKALMQYRDRGLRVVGTGANYVLGLPEVRDYLVKISGPVNRAILRLYAQDIDFHYRVRKLGTSDPLYKEYDHLQPRPVEEGTYQTASRKFGHLRLIEAIERYDLNRLEVPAMDIVNINTDEPNSCEDKDCVVVEKRLADGYRPANRDYRIFDDEAIRQLVIVIIYAGLWDIGFKNLFVDTTAGKIAIVDAEQANATKPHQRFYKEFRNYVWRAHNDGIEKLINCFPEKRDLIRRFEKIYKVERPQEQ